MKAARPNETSHRNEASLATLGADTPSSGDGANTHPPNPTSTQTVALYDKYRADVDRRPSKYHSDRFSRTFVWVENEDISLIKPLNGVCRDIPRSLDLPEWALDPHGTPSPEKLWIKELCDQGCVLVRGCGLQA